MCEEKMTLHQNAASVETKGWFGSEGSGLILGVIGFLFFQGLGVITAVVERGQKRRQLEGARRRRN